MSDMKFWLVAILALIAVPVVFAEKGTFVDQVQFVQYLDENTALEEVRNGNLDIYYFRVSSDRIDTEKTREVGHIAYWQTLQFPNLSIRFQLRK